MKIRLLEDLNHQRHRMTGKRGDVVDLPAETAEHLERTGHAEFVSPEPSVAESEPDQNAGEEGDVETPADGEPSEEAPEPHKKSKKKK